MGPAPACNTWLARFPRFTRPQRRLHAVLTAPRCGALDAFSPAAYTGFAAILSHCMKTRRLDRDAPMRGSLLLRWSSLLAATLLFSILAGCGGSNPPKTLLVTAAATSATIAVGGELQLKAEATFADGSTRDVTTSCRWTSGSTAVASVNSSGLVTGVGAGITEISGVFIAGSVAVASGVTVTVQ